MGDDNDRAAAARQGAEQRRHRHFEQAALRQDLGELALVASIQGVEDSQGQRYEHADPQVHVGQGRHDQVKK